MTRNILLVTLNEVCFLYLKADSANSGITFPYENKNLRCFDMQMIMPSILMKARHVELLALVMFILLFLAGTSKMGCVS